MIDYKARRDEEEEGPQGEAILLARAAILLLHLGLTSDAVSLLTEAAWQVRVSLATTPCPPASPP